MTDGIPEIVSPEQWQAARADLLREEKAFTRAQDALAAKRRRMPMTAVSGDYRFMGEDGPRSLLELFDGHRQLIVYRFFMDPGMDSYPERGCAGCSLLGDQIGFVPEHLKARDTRFVCVSRGAQEHLQAYRRKMGWTFDWYTLEDDFDADFDVAEWHGTNYFLRDGDAVHRTYFTDARGDEVGLLWQLLDRTAHGRQEQWEDSPRGWPQTPPYDWWSWHDQYDHATT